ncbi:MAG: hypothetical protein V7722_09355 [Porticoccus sp.]
MVDQLLFQDEVFSDDCSTAPGPVQLGQGGKKMKNKEDEIFHCS